MEKIFGCTITTIGPIYQLNNQRGPIKNILLTAEKIIELVSNDVELIIRAADTPEDLQKMNQIVTNIIANKKKGKSENIYNNITPQLIRLDNIINNSIKETDKIISKAKENVIVEDRTDIPVNNSIDIDKLNGYNNKTSVNVKDTLVEEDITGTNYTDELSTFSNNFDEINGEPIHDENIIKKEKSNKRRQ